MAKKSHMFLQIELEELEKEMALLQEKKPMFRRKKHEREIMDKQVAISLKKEELAYTPSEADIEKGRQEREKAEAREEKIRRQQELYREEDREVERQLMRERVKKQVQSQGM